MTEPARPGIALRIAVAGNRNIEPEPEPHLSSRIVEAFSAIEAAVLSLPSARRPSGGPDRSGAYSGRLPALRLVSGLADGGDQIASEAFLASSSDRVERSIAAILPFDVDTYRDRSRIDNVACFGALLRACCYVLELDGRYVDGEEESARRVRAAAYRAQADVLLRHADLVVAVDNPRAAAKRGGTRETISRALYLGLPVIYLPIDEDWLTVLRSVDDIDREPSHRNWREDVAASVRAILADPRASAAEREPGPSPSARETEELRDRRNYEDELLGEFFSAALPGPSFRRNVWSRFERWFRRGAAPANDAMPAAFLQWKSQASALSAYYAGLYRGTFLVNYSLTVVAVCLAVASQVVLILFPQTQVLGGVPWLVFVSFGIGQLAVIIAIQRLTNQANRYRWNDKAVDYRYLAERLRSMAYLPRIGSLRALPPGSAGYATRISTTSVVDWLFHAMVRHASLEEVTPPAGAGNHIRPDPYAAASAVRDGWIANQVRYHARNADAMGRMNRGLQTAGRVMNVAVVCVVTAGLALSVLDRLDIPSTVIRTSLPYLFLSPGFLFLAAALPAAVASLNGIRFQTECARLADRSTHMQRMLAVLESRARAVIAEIEPHCPDTAVVPGHTMDVLHLAEDCATLTVDEVAEWSFVYAKEIVAP